MKLYNKSPLVLLCLICSILFFSSCSKDSDLFVDAVLLDPEIENLENASSSDTAGSDEGGGSEPTDSTFRRGDILINDAFDSQGQWDFENGSNIANGVMTLLCDGNTSVRYSDILPKLYYATRRYRFTFDARQTNGSGDLELRQSNSSTWQQAITGSWVTYTVEANGNATNASNDINFRGRIAGDKFEIDNFKMEIIGGTTNPNVPGKDAQITFFTDFESATYGYDQWGANGANPSELNQWEVDKGTPRTTDHPEAHITSGRDGTGTAVWLGVYNESSTRNEIARDEALPFGEHWMGFSIYVQDSIGDGRIWMQNRLLAPGGSSTVNPVSLRQDRDTGKLYFTICTDVTRVDQTKASLGGWNGAGTGTEDVFVDYNFRGWNDIVIHYKGGFGANYSGPDTSSLLDDFGYDPRTDGFLEIWFNGVKVVDHVGTTIYRYEKNGGQIRWNMSPKIGPYWGGPVNFALGANGYYDNYSIWVGPNGTYSDVDPSK